MRYPPHRTTGTGQQEYSQEYKRKHWWL